MLLTRSCGGGGKARVEKEKEKGKAEEELVREGWFGGEWNVWNEAESQSELAVITLGRVWLECGGVEGGYA